MLLYVCVCVWVAGANVPAGPEENQHPGEGCTRMCTAVHVCMAHVCVWCVRVYMRWQCWHAAGPLVVNFSVTAICLLQCCFMLLCCVWSSLCLVKVHAWCPQRPLCPDRRDAISGARQSEAKWRCWEGGAVQDKTGACHRAGGWLCRDVCAIDATSVGWGACIYTYMHMLLPWAGVRACTWERRHATHTTVSARRHCSHGALQGPVLGRAFICAVRMPSGPSYTAMHIACLEGRRTMLRLSIHVLLS